MVTQQSDHQWHVSPRRPFHGCKHRCIHREILWNEFQGELNVELETTETGDSLLHDRRLPSGRMGSPTPLTSGRKEASPYLDGGLECWRESFLHCAMQPIRVDCGRRQLALTQRFESRSNHPLSVCVTGRRHRDFNREPEGTGQKTIWGSHPGSDARTNECHRNRLNVMGKRETNE